MFAQVFIKFLLFKEGLGFQPVSWLGRLVADQLTRWRPGFDNTSISIGFVANKVTLRPVFLCVLIFPIISIK